MTDLEENETFKYGLLCGITLYQQKIVTAHERREHIMIHDKIYYLQDGREQLEEAIDKICK